jgi:hypothetical protein
LQEFQDVCHDEVPSIPPKRKIDFSIDLIPGDAPMSQGFVQNEYPQTHGVENAIARIFTEYTFNRVCPHGEHQLCLCKRNMELSKGIFITGS